MLFGILRGEYGFMEALMQVLAILVIIFLVLPFHEWAHAYAALKLGDKSIKYTSRLSLNPVHHIDPVGALCILMFGFGWAKPVMINSRYFRNPKVGMAISAAAGPLANIVAAVAGAFMVNLLLIFYSSAAGALYYILLFFMFYTNVNISLAVFNLLPFPPLDGSKILFGFLPDSMAEMAYQLERYSYIILILIMTTGIMSGFMGFLSSAIYSGIMYVTALPFALVR